MILLCSRAILLLVCLLGPCQPAASENTPEPSEHSGDVLQVVVPTRDVATRADSAFFFPLLKLCLDKTLSSHGPYQLSYHPVALSSERIIANMRNGGPVNTMWTSTSARREKLLTFAPISLLGELSDHRVLLIREGEQAQFDKVETLDDLRQWRAGIGGHWPDARLLKNNGFQTVTSIYYDSLFRMLAAGRFDFFPRGLFEVKDDLDHYGQNTLAIEQRLLLHYPAPFYFFVSPDRPEILARLTEGLKRAQADGSYDKLMASMPAFVFGQSLLKQSRLRFDLEPDYR